MKKHDDPRFKQTYFACEANDFERICLWERYGPEGSVIQTKWGDNQIGLMAQIGKVSDMPVMLQCTWLTIEGHLVLFYNVCSRMADHNLTRPFLDLNLPKGYSHSDAMNFGNLLADIHDRK